VTGVVAHLCVCYSGVAQVLQCYYSAISVTVLLPCY
jgi:hypothetical protein